MPKTRPGVPAAKRLAASVNVSNWERIELQYNDVQDERLQELDAAIALLQDRLLQDDETAAAFITKDELLDTLLAWKFKVGKARPAVRKLVQQNSDESVRSCTQNAIAQAKQISGSFDIDDGNKKMQHAAIKTALTAGCNLSGVGPAGASALLCLVGPDIFPYMYDEVLEVWEAKRTYTIAAYLRLVDHCCSTAVKLNKHNSNDTAVWTAQRVAKTLWTAARLAALEENDGTTKSGSTKASSKRPVDENVKNKNASGKKIKK